MKHSSPPTIQATGRTPLTERYSDAKAEHPNVHGCSLQTTSPYPHSKGAQSHASLPRTSCHDGLPSGYPNPDNRPPSTAGTPSKSKDITLKTHLRTPTQKSPTLSTPLPTHASWKATQPRSTPLHRIPHPLPQASEASPRREKPGPRGGCD